MEFFGTFWALVPPLVAIVLALITKEAFSSLFIGVVLGGFLYSGFNPVGALNAVINDGFISAIADPWNAGIFLFLVLLGIMVALVNTSGGSAAFGRWATRHIKTKAGAMLATFLLGVLIFIDDYFNCLTVGSAMLPVTDGHRVSRAKLSYLIDATAAPICMIAPISSWAAAVSSTAQDLNTGITGIQLFIRAIPYNFYSLLTLVFVVLIIVTKVDFGPMKLAEMNARLGNDDSKLAMTPEDNGPENPKGRVIDLVLPIVILIIASVVGMLYVGGFWGGDYNMDFVGAFGNTDASVGLPWGALIALVLTIIYFLCRRTMNFKQAMACIPKGFVAMVPAILILTFALTLKNITGLLGAPDFVEGLMKSEVAQSLSRLLPAVIFLVALALAFATGTSWGTFGILIPIVCGMFPPTSELLIISISACLAGAVAGDHCSPISDTTIMASAGARCDHVKHVSTQLPYVMVVCAICLINFIIAGFVQNAIICLAIGLVMTVATVLVIKKLSGKNDTEQKVTN